MADLTRKEFASLCHTTPAVVNVNISRGKIMLLEDGKIDTENVLNKTFFERYLKKSKEKKTQEQQTEEQYNKTVKTLKKTRGRTAKKVSKSSREKQNADAEDISSLDKRIKQANVELTEHKAAHEKMKLDKLAGKLIPVDLVFQILNIHNKSIFATFQSDTENLASVFCEILAEGDRKKLSEITAKISENLLKVVEKSKENSKIELENAIAEYSQTLNRGQRK